MARIIDRILDGLARWRAVDPSVAAAQYVPPPHAHLLDEHPLERVGLGGSRRICYKLGDSGFCVKFYKPEELCETEQRRKKKCAGIQREIRNRRFDIRRNSSSQEVEAYESFWMKQPPAIREKLPPVVERVFDEKLGWGILETYYTNPDGTAIIPYEFEIERQESMANRLEIYRQAKELLEKLISCSATFYEPGNFHTLIRPDGGIETKIIDFEPESKMAIPLEAVLPWFRRMKLHRKAQRYLKHIRETYGLERERCDEPVLWDIVKAAAHADVYSMRRVRGGHSSLNWLVLLGDTRKIFLKWVPASKRRNLERTRTMWSLGISDLIPKPAFGGGIFPYDGGFLIGMEWKPGSVVRFEDLSRQQAEAFARAYVRLSADLQNYRGELGESRISERSTECQKVIHGDLNFANVLFHNGEVSAFLDFEMVRMGLPTEDLVRGFVHRAERLPIFAFRRRRRLMERFLWVVAATPYAREDWRLAIESYRRHKAARRGRHHRLPIVRFLESAMRDPFCRHLRDIIPM